MRDFCPAATRDKKLGFALPHFGNGQHPYRLTEANLTQRQRGRLVVKSIPQLSLKAVYPRPTPEINLNTCGDVDCGNFGIAPDFTLPVFKGPGASQRKMLELTTNSALSTGRGLYTLNGDDKNERVSQAFEYEHDPRVWDDGRAMVCRHQNGNAECGVSFSVLSNDHLLDEIDRLRTQNGLLEGPVCGNCGTRYLDRPEEFIFNGTHGTLKPNGNRRKEKPSGFRIIHRPCKGKPAARISATLDHQGQKKQHDNVRLLRALVNGASINDLRRLLSDPDTGKKCGVSRIYSRIFWLEKTLLAFEKAKLQEWKAREEASNRFIHTRVAHDDVIVSVNWESRQDRRLTPLHFSVSADIRSGYVFRIDANFDPRVDPAAFFEQEYLDQRGQPKNIRGHYTRPSGQVVSAPLLHFQRSSGRFDEAAFFASAAGSWRVFSDRLERAYEDDIALGLALPAEVQTKIDLARDRRKILDEVCNGYLGLVDTSRDYRGSFNGIMVKPTYTKAAHLACVRDMLPEGKITLVGEQESTMVRVVPHIFRNMIQDDLFEWFVVSFDKKASTPKTWSRIKKFEQHFAAFEEQELAAGAGELPKYEMLRRFCSAKLATSVGRDRQGNALPFPIANFQSAQFPQFWAKSPVQHFGETEKTVGFPIVRSKYRQSLRAVGFNQEVTDPDLRDAVARRVLNATLQPVSAFMNSLRMRTSQTGRAGGRSARSGASYINGASFNPAVLVAILNIYRVYYNWFEPRQYVGTGSAGSETSEVEKGASSVRVPGSGEVVQIPKRRTTAPVMRTPAMRLGADTHRDKAPDPRRLLYRPWLFHGTPLWRKFETR